MRHLSPRTPWIAGCLVAGSCTGTEGDPASSRPANPGDADTDADGDSDIDVDSGTDTTAQSETSPVSWALVAGTTRKVCQLVGDDDRELGIATSNRTDARYGLWGTDLGASFGHDGKTWFLFGDALPTGGGTPNPECGDAIAWTEDNDASDCIDLTFLTDSGGSFQSPEVPGVSLGCYEVPLAGVSADGRMYVWFSTDTMTRSILARSTDGARSFSSVRDWSSEHFVNVAVDVAPGGPEWPAGDGDRLVVIGSGPFRSSHPYLATVPLASVEDAASVRYFGGLDDAGAPIWRDREDLAEPLFEQPCVGELSAHHDPVMDTWVLLYNCSDPRGIVLRTAPDPWGPWSEAAVAFEPWNDGGYCHFLHTAWDYDVCDSVHDDGREYEWGGEYGAYAVAALTRPTGDGAVISYTMSTWNPYTVVLMETELAPVE